jgi:hypothetical protein
MVSKPPCASSRTPHPARSPIASAASACHPFRAKKSQPCLMVAGCAKKAARCCSHLLSVAALSAPIAELTRSIAHEAHGCRCGTDRFCSSFPVMPGSGSPTLLCRRCPIPRTAAPSDNHPSDLGKGDNGRSWRFSLRLLDNVALAGQRSAPGGGKRSASTGYGHSAADFARDANNWVRPGVVERGIVWRARSGER